MQITITTLDASDDDCRREDFFTTVNGVPYTLAVSALDEREAESRARELFGPEVEIKYA